MAHRSTPLCDRDGTASGRSGQPLLAYSFRLIAVAHCEYDQRVLWTLCSGPFRLLTSVRDEYLAPLLPRTGVLSAGALLVENILAEYSSAILRPIA